MKSVQLSNTVVAELNGTKVAIIVEGNQMYSGEIAGLPLEGWGHELEHLIRQAHVQYRGNPHTTADVEDLQNKQIACDKLCAKLFDHNLPLEGMPKLHFEIEKQAEELLAAIIKTYQYHEVV